MPIGLPQKIMIVRPEAQAKKDIEQCRAVGIEAEAVSPIVLEPHQQALLDLQIQAQAADVMFWVSPGAVSVAAPQLNWSQISATQVAVGESTAIALQSFVEQVVYPENGRDSEAVLALPLWNQLAKDAEVLLVRGEKGRTLLADTLMQKGLKITAADVYFRRPQIIDWSIITAFEPQAVYIASAENAHVWLTQMPPKLAQPLKNLLYLTQHVRIADVLREGGIKQIQLIDTLAHYLKPTV